MGSKTWGVGREGGVFFFFSFTGQLYQTRTHSPKTPLDAAVRRNAPRGDCTAITPWLERTAEGRAALSRNFAAMVGAKITAFARRIGRLCPSRTAHAGCSAFKREPGCYPNAFNTAPVPGAMCRASGQSLSLFRMWKRGW